MNRRGFFRRMLAAGAGLAAAAIGLPSIGPRAFEALGPGFVGTVVKVNDDGTVWVAVGKLPHEVSVLS